jgi:hypothetical protein
MYHLLIKLRAGDRGGHVMLCSTLLFQRKTVTFGDCRAAFPKRRDV